MAGQAQPRKSQEEIRFDILTNLELTCGALEEAYLLKSKGMADSQINAKIKHDLGALLADFNNSFFKTKGSTKELWKTDGIVSRLSKPGIYCLGVIGKQIKDKEGHETKPPNRALSYIMGRMKYVTGKDYARASKFFGKIAEIAGDGAGEVGF